jgi:ABC-type bacteriocin/lantibiotic exporter with double-glycine peptidase domain
LNILFGKLRYTGVVRMGGLDVDQAEVSNWRKHIIFVPQTVTLFNDTVYYNVAYGNDASRQDVLAAMTKYQIFTIDLDTQVGRLGENLSGGQRQIIFLLRSYFRKNIKLVLMDEPTSALDANTRDNAMILINDIIKDRTAIIVTHDPSIVDLSTKTLTLETCN